MKRTILFVVCVTLLFGCTEPNPSINKLVSVALLGSTSAPLAVDSTYTFTATCTNQEGQKPTSQQLVCVLETTDSLYVLSQTSDKGAISDSMALQVSFSELPDLVWQRDSATRIIGKIVYSGVCAQHEFRKELPIALLYKPNKPILTVDTLQVGDSIQATLHFSAEGTLNYSINYFGYRELVSRHVSLSSDYDTYHLVLANNQMWKLSVTAINDYGTSISEESTIGQNYGQLELYLTKSGNMVTYHFKRGSEVITDLDVAEALVIGAENNVEMVLSAGIGEPFDVSTLSVGYHIVRVTLADTRVFNARFTKR